MRPSIDRTANGRPLISRRHTGVRKSRAWPRQALAARPRGAELCAFVEPAAVFEHAVGVVAEEIRRADRPVGLRDCLGLVAKIGRALLVSWTSER